MAMPEVTFLVHALLRPTWCRCLTRPHATCKLLAHPLSLGGIRRRRRTTTCRW